MKYKLKFLHHFAFKATNFIGQNGVLFDPQKGNQESK